MAKKMYVVQSVEHGAYWCGLNHWDDQLRKAQIFHSLKCVDDVYQRFKHMKLKTVEIYMGIVPEHPTNADRIRAMTDEELAEIIMCPCDNDPNSYMPGSKCLDCCLDCCLKWLQQPCEDSLVEKG